MLGLTNVRERQTFNLLSVWIWALENDCSVIPLESSKEQSKVAWMLIWEETCDPNNIPILMIASVLPLRITGNEKASLTKGISFETNFPTAKFCWLATSELEWVLHNPA